MPKAATKPARTLGAVTLAAALLCLTLTPAAHAADSVYWVNYKANKISHANLGGGGGADLPIPAAPFDGPWGLAIDPAAGKVYWANENNDTIGYGNLDGSGSGLLSTAGATVDNPIGLAIDPTGGRVYWTSFQGNKISYANLNGTGGADLNTTGATVDKPSGLALEPAGGRIYWTNYGADKISYANLNGSGGADLNIVGAVPNGPEGIAVDAAAGRVYWTNIDGNTLSYASVNGSGGGQLNTGGATVDQPVGLAVDPIAARVYWANIGNDTIMYAGLSSGSPGGQVDTSGASPGGIAFPVLLETPRNTVAPIAYGGHRPGVVLACRKGAWAGDLIESFLYRAPQTFSYQWLRNGQPVAEAVSSGFIPEKAGKYSCRETATNFAGPSSQPSNEVAVVPTMRLNRGTLDFKSGTARQPVTVTGRGRVTLSGPGVVRRRQTSKKVSGRVTLRVTAKGKARKKLNATGKARVRVTVSFAAEASKALRQSKTIVLKRRPLPGR